MIIRNEKNLRHGRASESRSAAFNGFVAFGFGFASASAEATGEGGAHKAQHTTQGCTGRDALVKQTKQKHTTQLDSKTTRIRPGSNWTPGCVLLLLLM
jgi:hypothetical protein